KMINLYNTIILLNICGISSCNDLKILELDNNEEIKIQESNFSIKSIRSLQNLSSEYGWVNYILLSNKSNGFQIIIDDNTRTFSIYMSPSCKNYFAISNNYASRENKITIYSFINKEPYVHIIYQTPNNEQSRTSWSIKSWKNNKIIMTNSTEGEKEIDKEFLLQ
ncbi:MAG: hypothetical protein RR419_05775, partial [Akkermansia sp.]